MSEGILPERPGEARYPVLYGDVDAEMRQAFEFIEMKNRQPNNIFSDQPMEIGQCFSINVWQNSIQVTRNYETFQDNYLDCDKPYGLNMATMIGILPITEGFITR